MKIPSTRPAINAGVQSFPLPVVSVFTRISAVPAKSLANKQCCHRYLNIFIPKCSDSLPNQIDLNLNQQLHLRKPQYKQC